MDTSRLSLAIAAFPLRVVDDLCLTEIGADARTYMYQCSLVDGPPEQVHHRDYTGVLGPEGCCLTSGDEVHICR